MRGATVAPAAARARLCAQVLLPGGEDGGRRRWRGWNSSSAWAAAGPHRPRARAASDIAGHAASRAAPGGVRGRPGAVERVRTPRRRRTAAPVPPPGADAASRAVAQQHAAACGPRVRGARRRAGTRRSGAPSGAAPGGDRPMAVAGAGRLARRPGGDPRPVAGDPRPDPQPQPGDLDDGLLRQRARGQRRGPHGATIGFNIPKAAAGLPRHGQARGPAAPGAGPAVRRRRGGSGARRSAGQASAAGRAAPGARGAGLPARRRGPPAPAAVPAAGPDPRRRRPAARTTG